MWDRIHGAPGRAGSCTEPAMRLASHFATTRVMPATSSRNLRAALTRAGLTFADPTCAGLTFADDNGLVWQSAGR
jgi:hypothetical protein